MVSARHSDPGPSCNVYDDDATRKRGTMKKDDTACPFCQSKNLSLKYALTDSAYHTAKCRDCGFVAMHPYPADAFLNEHYKARELYNSGQDSASYGRAVADRASLIRRMLERAGITALSGLSV